MIEWISGVIGHSGLLGLMFLAFMENIFPPVPSEIIMPCAGHLVREGQLNLIAAVALGALGSSVGALPLYFVSRALGEKRVRNLMDRYGKWIGLGNEEYDKTQNWFVRYGNRAVFWCRIIPGLRGIISIPAGVARMPVVTFFLLSYIGCFVWTLFLIMSGYWLGDSFIKVEHILGPTSKFIIAALVVLLLWRAYRKNAHTKDDGQKSPAV